MKAVLTIPVRRLTFFLGAVFFTAVSCEAPSEPIASAWVFVADFPDYGRSVYGITRASAGVYAAVAGSRGGEQTDMVIKYSRKKFSIEFNLNKWYEEGRLTDVATFGGDVWAGGQKREGDEVSPFLVGVSRRTEIILPETPYDLISTIIPVNEDEYWLLFDENYYSGTHKGFLGKYRRGGIELYDDFGEVTAVRSTDPKAPPTLYAVSYNADDFGHLGGGAPVTVFITTDEGLSWAEESLPGDVVPGRRIEWATAGATRGADLYLIVSWHGDGDYLGLVRRSGAPGAGVYELAFMAPTGPYFRGFVGIAFEDPTNERYGISTDGVGVGVQTSVVFDAGEVRLERLPYPMNFEFITPAAGSGFWAVAENEGFGGTELLYHP